MRAFGSTADAFFDFLFGNDCFPFMVRVEIAYIRNDAPARERVEFELYGLVNERRMLVTSIK